MVGGATSAFISRRLRTTQARALREHGVDPSAISVGRTFAIGCHHRVFNLRLRLAFWFRQAPLWEGKSTSPRVENPSRV
jgi:hypothetical protein